MRYNISHRTKYTYSTPVSVCQNIVTLTPREDSRVQCLLHRLRIRPNPTNTHHRTDYFGNQVTVFSIDENHDELVISSASRVSVQAQSLDPNARRLDWQSVCRSLMNHQDPNWLEASSFLFNSPRITRREEYADFARESFPNGTPIVDAVESLTQRIFKGFQYDAKATQSHTTTELVFKTRQGVCQDFAHVMISCLRSIGLPARYISGYLQTIPPPGKPRLIGADQSHAWVAVYCGPQLGWVEFDPTNNCLVGDAHIPIAWGRDYSDVVPVRGAYLGGGESDLAVAVDVAYLA